MIKLRIMINNIFIKDWLIVSEIEIILDILKIKMREIKFLVLLGL